MCYDDTLRNMTPARTKMVLVFYFLVRILIPKILMAPWDLFKQIVTKNETMVRNLRTVASIIFFACFDFVQGSVPAVPNNQDHLSNDLKVNRRETPIKVDAEEADPDSPSKKGKKEEDEIFDGLYSRAQLIWLYTAKKQWYGPLNTPLSNLCLLGRTR